MSDENWKILQTDPLIRHPFLNVDLLTLQLPNGRIIPDWHHIHARDYINVFVLTEEKQALIIEGYKHGVGRATWQVVGGYLESGEDPLETARRELMEETGYTSDSWQHLGSFVVDANRHVGVGHFFLAQNARRVAAPDHDDLEQMTLRLESLEAVRQALFTNKVGALSYATAISLALLWLDSHPES